MGKKFKFSISINQPWITMMNDDKFITITTSNESRDNHGIMTIGLTKDWLNRDYDNSKSNYEKVLWIDTEEKFIKFYNALLELEGCDIE